MAISKHYAYYTEGNKIALIEKDVEFDNDVNNKDYGPGSSRQRWESPSSSVTDGLKIKYSYAPIYRVNDNSDVLNITAYAEDSGCLSLTVDSVTIAADKWILIVGSDRWNGLHQVKTEATGVTTLLLKTKYNGASVTEASRFRQDISVIEDESFELDLPNYLQKALVYYVKAKLAEDAGEFKLREYAMREFKKMIEKYDSSKISGLRIMVPGSHAIR